MAAGNTFPAFGHNPGKKRHVEEVEHVAYHPDLLFGYFRNIPDPFRSALIVHAFAESALGPMSYIYRVNFWSFRVALLIYR